MKWLEEHQIDAIVLEMRQAFLEGRVDRREILVEGPPIRVKVDGREVKPSTPELRLLGVARPVDNANGLLLVFDRKPTDDELRAIHERLQ